MQAGLLAEATLTLGSFKPAGKAERHELRFHCTLPRYNVSPKTKWKTAIIDFACTEPNLSQ
jgi:hypothetical protein